MKKREGLLDEIYAVIKEYLQPGAGHGTASNELKVKDCKFRGVNGNSFKPWNNNGNGAMPGHNYKLALDGKSKTIDLMEYWRVIVKRKWVAISVCTLVLIFVGILTFTATPLYRAQATVLIEQPPSNILSLQDLFSPAPQYDYLNQFFDTQLKLLSSRSLAERVAKKMDLKARPEIHSAQSKRSLLRNAKSLLSLKWIRAKKKEEEKEPEHRLDTDPNERYAGIVEAGLNLSPVKNTRLVHVSYTSPYPALAADIVNT